MLFLFSTSFISYLDDKIEVDFEGLSTPNPPGLLEVRSNVDVVLAFFDSVRSSGVGGTGRLNPVLDTGDVKSGMAEIGFKSSGEDKMIGRSTIDIERRNLNEPTPRTDVTFKFGYQTPYGPPSV